MERHVLHCDLNAFFASVEEALDPSLRKYPVAVCGNPEDRHGIILAKNEAAKKFGVKTAETIWQARRKCPSLVLVPPHYDKYTEYSKIVNEIYLHYTDLVEPFGIDESWLDVTGSAHLFGTPKQIADEIRSVIKSETGLTASVGVSFNKCFAKLGSDYKKPDATTVISRGDFREIVWPLPVGALLFVGKSAVKTLNRLGIKTIGELANSDKSSLAAIMGKGGEMIHDYANGKDDSPVNSAFYVHEPKSIGKGTTFSHDLIDPADIKTAIFALADDVAARMRKQNMRCCAVSLTIRYPDFKTVSHQKALLSPTYLGRDVSDACMEIFEKFFSFAAKPIRMITVTALNLVCADESAEQISMFSDMLARKRRENVELTMDKIRNRFGKDAIEKASVFKNDFGLKRSRGDNDDDVIFKKIP